MCKSQIGMDRQRNDRQSAPVARDDGGRGVGEVLVAVAANVAAVPVVLAFVALGGVVLAGRVLVDVAGQALGSRNGRRPSRKKPARQASTPAAAETTASDGQRPETTGTPAR